MVAFSRSMGKIKRQKISKIKLGKPERNVPLADQIDGDKYETQSLRRKERKRQEEDEVIDDRMSVKILREAKKQQEEIEEEEGLRSSSRTAPKIVKLGESDESEEEYDLDENEDIDYQHMEVAPEDEKAFELFMSDKPSTRRTIADMIQEKITEKQTELKSQLSDQSCHVQELDERVVSMYKQVKEILMHYRGGKLPKAFKIIPSLQNWEQILFLTEPDRWSAAAVYQATKIFASNLNQKKAQRFYNVVLFPRLRDDIAEYKRLNYHLYLALGKALFKSAAFFKGILLPLCEGGDCTLLEAVVLSSVVAKHSIPMLHSAAAMLKIAEMPYSGASSIFLRVLIDKKYALPFRVVDAVVHHFLKFQSEKRHLPVLWHQCLLTFAQRYKEDLSSEQKESLLELIKAKSHHLISAEIRRELSQSKCRDEESELHAEQALQQGEMCWE